MIETIQLKSLLVDGDQTLRFALKKINKSGVGACFLIKNKKLKNVISDGDIRRALLKNLKLTDKIKKVKIKKKCVFLKKNSDFLESYKKISKYKIIPVINNNGEVIDYADNKRFRQLPQSEPQFHGNEMLYISEVIESGWISSRGKYVDLFEQKFSNFVKNKFCLSTSSGTTALHLSIATLKLKKDDEIIVPDYTFVSPINAIIHAGCKPVLADIDSESLCISFESIKKLTNKKTKAIILVHLYGNTPEIEKIVNFCRKKKISIIEDCAEAFGTKFKNTHVGRFGDFGTFSFFGNKTISTGEGGMILFKNKKDYILAKKLRNHGMKDEKKYWHDEIGFNFRITSMQGAIGCAQIEKANTFIKKKIDIYNKYKSKLKKLSYISLANQKNYIKNSHWLTYIKINNQVKNKKKVRDSLLKHLTDNGVEARNGFYGSHLMKIYKPYKSNKLTYNNSKDISSSLITLPSSVTLKDKEINYICNLIVNFKV